MTHSKFANAYSKLDNAAEHIAKANDVLQKSPPFTYVLETKIHTRERATFAKKNEAAIRTIGNVTGDVLQNIRGALDFGYWQVVSPFVSLEKERSQIQFPFCKEANGLGEALTRRFANRVGTDFVNDLTALKPYGEEGGNRLLYLLNHIAIGDRHRGYAPIGDYTKITYEIIQREVPDFPMIYGEVSFGMNKRDIGWPIERLDVRQRAIGMEVSGSNGVFEKELIVPVDILLEIREAGYSGPLIPTLYELRDIVLTTLGIIEKYA